MNKEQLIDGIVQILKTEFQGRDAVVTERDREFLKNSTVTWLENKLRQLQADVAVKHRQQQPQILGDKDREDLAWTHISRVQINGKMAVDNSANRQIVFGWLHEDQGEQPTVSWFKRVLEEAPALANQILWEPILSKEQRKQAAERQLERDRATFAELCRENLLSQCQANFEVWTSTNSIIGLAAASPEELEAYRQEAADKRQDFLLNADPTTLRSEVRRESVERQAAVAQEQAARELEFAKQRDQYRGYKPLPLEIDSKAIQGAAPEKLKSWMRVYGSYQLTSRVRGEN
jgi:hypothetical protein